MLFNPDDRARYKRLLSYIRPHWKVVLALLSATVVYGLTEPLVPMVMKPLIDGGFAARDMGTVYLMTALLFVGFAVRGIANFTSSYLMTWLSQNVVYTLRDAMFAKLLKLPMRYFDQHSQGSIISRFTYDVLQLMSASTDAVAILVRETITITALLAYLLWLDWKLTLLVLLCAPFLALLIIRFSRRLRKIAHALQADMSGMNHVLDETLRGRAIIRIYNGDAYEYRRFNQQADTVRRHILKSGKIAGLISPIVEIIIIAALCAIILIAAHKAQNAPAHMTTGTFIAFLGAMALLFPPIKRLGKVTEPIQRGLAATQSIFDFLDEADETQAALPPFVITRGDIRFDNISFAYHNEQPVLAHFSLHIRAGETVALVGASGSGKSTLAALLAGFYAPDSGTLYLDDRDVRSISLKDRRRAIAYVAQDTILFATSVAANIAYADDTPDEQRIEAAAQSANAADFIAKLPQGYQSHIGQQGGKLSGGQRQRLAIARALYKNAPILILDEATSALDSESERKVQQAIENLQQNRTAIIIAHRLSTIRNADRIIVLDQGRIVESGTHHELRDQGGHYAHLLAQNRFE
ncbi:MAG: lipid A export permease/ATP-binding protein MsbA [Cardiobacteriaceae bacterium]|nr:lipid A export permease/ATP-binding protein MsbA [Cardiobacteriaceae bacterium]